MHDDHVGFPTPLTGGTQMAIMRYVKEVKTRVLMFENVSHIRAKRAVDEAQVRAL
jgi:hypothetical protein